MAVCAASKPWGSRQMRSDRLGGEDRRLRNELVSSLPLSEPRFGLCQFACWLGLQSLP